MEDGSRRGKDVKVDVLIYEYEQDKKMWTLERKLGMHLSMKKFERHKKDGMDIYLATNKL